MEVLTGRLTADATVKEISGGKQVVNFSIAVNDRYKTKSGEAKENTRYFRCAYWNSTGIAPFLKKGGLVGLTGRIDLQVWNDQEGHAKGVLTLNVNNIKLHGKSQKQDAATSEEQMQPGSQPTDDLPF